MAIAVISLSAVPGAARRLVARAWLAFALVGVAAAHAQNTDAQKSFKDQVQSLVWWGDLEALQRLNQDLHQHDRRDPDGSSRLIAYRVAVSDTFAGRKDVPDAYFVAQDTYSLALAQQFPQSPLVHVLHAQSLLSHAWSYRGTGLAHTVPPAAWADFERLVQRSAQYLARHAEVAFRTSDAHAVMIAIGRASGWPPDRLWALAQEGLKLNPQDDDLYFRVLTSLLPKWGGSAQGVDRFINEVVERTRATRGEEMYARLYAWAAQQQFQHGVFKDSGVQWARMKTGFDHWVSRYPDVGVRNRYAYFACMAQDKAAMLDQMEHIGSGVDLAAWAPNANRTLETCRRWAAQQ